LVVTQTDRIIIVEMALCEASFPWVDHDETVLHPSIEEKGITTMRLQRLHFNSRPSPHTFAMSWPHSQRVSVL